MVDKHPGVIINRVQENEVAIYSHKTLLGIMVGKFSN